MDWGLHMFGCARYVALEQSSVSNRLYQVIMQRHGLCNSIAIQVHKSSQISPCKEILQIVCQTFSDTIQLRVCWDSPPTGLISLSGFVLSILSILEYCTKFGKLSQ